MILVLLCRKTNIIDICLHIMPHIPRPQILDFCGMKMNMFENREEALAAAEEEIGKNQKEFGHSYETHAIQTSSINPLMNKYWYVRSDGCKRKWNQTEVKTLKGESAVKSTKHLEQSQAFLEAMGSGASSSKDEPTKHM